MALTLKAVPASFRGFIMALLTFAFFLGIPVFHYVIAVMVAVVINTFRTDLAHDHLPAYGVLERPVLTEVHHAAATD
jgi:fructose-1,6-bisphosphatase/inositol monophosphatase family enzyme